MPQSTQDNQIDNLEPFTAEEEIEESKNYEKTSLEALDWTNIFLPSTKNTPIMYTPTSSTGGNTHKQEPIPQIMKGAATALHNEISEKAAQILSELRITQPHASSWDIPPFYHTTKQNIIVRVTPVQTLHGNEFILRKLSPFILDEEDLDLPKPFLETINLWLTRPGISLISGRFATRKTTHCYSYLKHHLKTYGGIGFIVDSPAETDFSLETFTNAHCIQVDINQNPDRKNRWENITNIIRKSSATIIYAGEISTPEAAIFLLQQAHTGRSVFANLHGENIPTAIENLISLAEKGGMKEDSARNILSDSLVGVACQAISNGQPIMEVLQVLSPHELETEVEESRIRDAISTGNYEQNKDFVEKAYTEQTTYLNRQSQNHSA